jgi:hypothetical protein
MSKMINLNSLLNNSNLKRNYNEKMEITKIK